MRAGGLVVIFLCACGKGDGDKPARPPVVGGPCDYVDFSGTCKLMDVTVEPDDATTSALTVTYEYEPEHTTIGFQVGVDNDKVEAAKAYYRAHAEAPCHGQRITHGTCTPVIGQIDLPDPP